MTFRWVSTQHGVQRNGGDLSARHRGRDDDGWVRRWGIAGLLKEMHDEAVAPRRVASTRVSRQKGRACTTCCDEPARQAPPN